MNKSKYLILGLLLIVVSQANPAAAIVCPAQTVRPDPSLREYYVKELRQEGVSLPDKPIQNTWKYDISWKPARHQGALVKAYKLKPNGCASHTYACTDARCNAKILGCSTRLSGTWVAVTADIGSVSGVRLGTIFKPGACD